MTFTPKHSPVLGRFMGDSNSQSALTQRMAASALVGKLEAICAADVLSEADEADARVILVKAYRAFGFDSVAERPAVRVGDHDLEYDETLAVVGAQMNRS